MTHPTTSNCVSWIYISVAALLLSACATNTKPQAQEASSGSSSTVAVAAELPSPTKPILVFDADTSQAYEILGEVTAVIKDQRVYNYEGLKDQARENLKRAAFAKYGERLDAIINYRSTTIIGGGGFWGTMGAVYGAKNTEVQASGIAVQFGKGKKRPSPVK